MRFTTTKLIEKKNTKIRIKINKKDIDKIKRTAKVSSTTIVELPPTKLLRRVETATKGQDKQMKTPDSILGKWSSEEVRENEYMSIKDKKEKMAHGTNNTNENKYMEVDGEHLNIYDNKSYPTTAASQVAIDLVEELEDNEDENHELECQIMATYHFKDINRIIKKADGWHYLHNTGKPPVKPMSAPPNTYIVSFYRELEKQGKQPSKVNSLALVFKKEIEWNKKTKEKLQKKQTKTNKITPTKGRDDTMKMAKQDNDKLWTTPREQRAQNEGKPKMEMKHQLLRRKSNLRKK